ncbi:MAG: DeoR/GlpR family DNA-binding transcription regulator [Erysipelotrichaceae bacterium]
MFVVERQNKILEMLNNQGKVKVKELSLLFDVSEDLIRKDLSFLCEKGLCVKAYGGATLVKQNLHNYQIQQRKNSNIKNKQIIAKKALKLINEKDVIFLDISTINIELAYLIKDKFHQLTVVTNMIDVMNILIDSPIKLIFIGGNINDQHDGFVGPLSVSHINNFYYDIAFLGTVGLNFENQCIQTYDIFDGECKQAIIKNSKYKVVLLEEHKINNIGNYNYAKFNDINLYIFDDVNSANSQLLSTYQITHQ